MAEQNLQRRLAEQNILNRWEPKPRRTQPQTDGCEAYEVTIPEPLAAEMQRYLGEHKGVDFNDVIAQALEAWFAATPPTMGG
jgi:hypothetical protein